MSKHPPCLPGLFDQGETFKPPPTLVARLAAYFSARPGEWIDGKDLAAIAGGYAWRTRVSDLRQQHGMIVNNRVRRIPGEARRVSEYQFVGVDWERSRRRHE